MMRPFLSYYGGKWRAAPHYPAPKYGTIVEPFAGGAGYAIRYHERDVILVEKDPKVAAVWRYLIDADPDRIRSLPDIGPETVDVHDIDEPERWLIGFWLNGGVAAPRKSPSAWARGRPNAGKFWGARLRDRLARQVQQIRHWRIIEGDFADAPDIDATWFVDPPYAQAGVHYPQRMKAADFGRLAGWCRARRGQVIACENVGADWLPFRPFRRIKATTKGGEGRWSHEAIWTGAQS